MAMFVTVSGAVINIVLDALFVFGFQWGMYGAAWATVIGQIISAAIAIRYLMHYHTVTLEKQHFIPSGKFSHRSVPSACPQALTRLPDDRADRHEQPVKTLRRTVRLWRIHPIACAGIVMKVNQLYFSILSDCPREASQLKV